MEMQEPTVPLPIPGLTEEESLEVYRIDVEGMMYGYHSLSADKVQRLLELQIKMGQQQ